jgi:hypothetical protein
MQHFGAAIEMGHWGAAIRFGDEPPTNGGDIGVSAQVEATIEGIWGAQQLFTAAAERLFGAGKTPRSERCMCFGTNASVKSSDTTQALKRRDY